MKNFKTREGGGAQRRFGLFPKKHHFWCWGFLLNTQPVRSLNIRIFRQTSILTVCLFPGVLNTLVHRFTIVKRSAFGNTGLTHILSKNLFLTHYFHPSMRPMLSTTWLSAGAVQANGRRRFCQWTTQPEQPAATMLGIARPPQDNPYSWTAVSITASQ